MYIKQSHVSYHIRIRQNYMQCDIQILILTDYFLCEITSFVGKVNICNLRILYVAHVIGVVFAVRLPS